MDNPRGPLGGDDMTGLPPPDQIGPALGAVLNHTRTSAGLTAADVAARMSGVITPDLLYQIERATKTCTVPRLVQVCTALQVDPPDVLRRALNWPRTTEHGVVIAYSAAQRHTALLTRLLLYARRDGIPSPDRPDNVRLYLPPLTAYLGLPDSAVLNALSSLRSTQVNP
jgi:hypothetical protein